MSFIALRSLKGDDDAEPIVLGESRYANDTDHGGPVVDESTETGLRYINPSLILPLEDVWVSKRRSNGNGHDASREEEENI